MSDIYDTRTGRVMAGGAGHAKTGAAMKKRLSALREACPEANRKSNQELVQLLENYNDSTEDVIEALRTGEADAVTGGWAVTSKKGKTGKTKKTSESDLGKDNASETSNSRSREIVTAAPAATSKTKPEQSKSKQLNGEAAPFVPASAKQATQQQSKRAEKNASVINNDHHRLSNQQPQSNNAHIPEEVPIPDIHSHSVSFTRLLGQTSENHMEDIKNLDFAFDQVRHLLEHRYEALRRSLERNDEQTRATLEQRRRQSSELSDRLAQASALMPKEYADWQQEVTVFSSDYKYDLHLATYPRFAYSLENLQKELNKFGFVDNFLPNYAYKGVEIPPRLPEKQPVYTPAPIGTAKQPQNSGSQRSTPRNQAPVNNQVKAPVTQTNVRADEPTNTRVNEKRSQAEIHERVTIVPTNVTGFVPMESVVISGGNLTPEELASLTQSLQSSLQFTNGPLNNNNQQPAINGGFNNGLSSEADIFSGGVWTNSNAAFGSPSDHWNPAADPNVHIQMHSDDFGQMPPANNFTGYQNRNGGDNFTGNANRGGGFRGNRRGARGGPQGNNRGARPFRGGPGRRGRT